MQDLKPGNLIFMDLPSPDFGLAVSTVYRGWRNLPINHVALVLDKNEIIEAGRPGVGIIPLKEYFQKLRSEGIEQVVSAGLNQPTDGLLGNFFLGRVTSWARGQEGKPYNHSFLPGQDSYYCSQLVAEAFRYALGRPFFPEYPMNFQDPETGKILPYWLKYYAELGLTVPQGAPGSHPATQSLFSGLKLEILKL